MEFSAADPARFRLSDCGKYLIEKSETKDGPRYAIWHYEYVAGGYESMEDVKRAILMREPEKRIQNSDSSGGGPSV